MKKLFLILFLGIIVASCGRNQTEIPTEIVTETPAVEVNEETLEEVAQTEITESSQNSSTTVNLSVEEMFSTVESTSKYIENTVWTHTTVGSTIWSRFVFSNGGVKVYSAFPRDGKWGAPKEYAYEIKERRFSDTGEKYISIIVNGDKSMNWEICPERGILRTPGGRQVSLELGDYQWD